MSLASNNFDHFMPFAREAYEVGHKLALEKAREASHAASGSEELILQEAYSIDAFACHFLTDSFASGHIRSVRFPISQIKLRSNRNYEYFTSISPTSRRNLDTSSCTFYRR